MSFVSRLLHNRVLRSATLALVFTTLAATASVAQVFWSEVGDAGDLPATAQTTAGIGPLLNITGQLSNDLDVDMYCIHIVNEPLFLASLQCVVNMGPVPFLFTGSGFGKATNETCSGGMKQLTSTFVSANGTYLLGVAYFGRTPVSTLGNIWLPALTTERAADGPGAAFPITGWTGVTTVNPLNPYTFALQGCEPCQLPVPVQPGTWGRVRSLYR